MNLEGVPVSYLSLLPLKTREKLLWRLPIADICKLEGTKFVEGFQDMAAYWKLSCEEFEGIAPGDIDITRYVEEWDEAVYAKAILYGQVATFVIGCLSEDFYFHLPFGRTLNPHYADIMSFLYAVRKPLVSPDRELESGCDLIFPPRYDQNSQLTSKKDITNTVVDCFKGELPQILAEVRLYEDIDYEFYYHDCDLLSKVVYLGIRGSPFEITGLWFVQRVVEQSTCLEVLVLEGLHCEEDERVSLNELFAFLSTQFKFLSRFRLLKILPNCAGYTLLQENLNKLATAYFSATTTHSQKIQITNTKIKSYDSDVCPVIDQCCTQFKVIELEDCYFVSKQKSSHRAVTQWLGQDISMLHIAAKKDNCCVFKVKNQAPCLLGRKRKHLELDNCDEDSQN